MWASRSNRSESRSPRTKSPHVFPATPRSRSCLPCGAGSRRRRLECGCSSMLHGSRLRRTREEDIAMPSPFPGMDPYLESSAYWRGFHSSMIPAISAQLNRTLPEGFAAFIEERIYIIAPDNYVTPDVVITRKPVPRVVKLRGSTVLERTADASETVTYYPDRVR